MATAFLAMQDRVLGWLHMTQGAGVAAMRAKVKTYLNNCGREFWGRHEWKERHATAFVSTLAPYATGTATFTQGSASVTGASTVWAAAHTGMKIALVYGGPWYVFTRTGATTGTLDRNYVEADASASAYVLYQDLYTLAATAEQILSHEVTLHRDGYGMLGPIRRSEGEAVWTFPIGAGTPTWWEQHDVVAGAMRIRVGPYAPDAVYSIRYGHLTLYTDMSATTDECVVPERWRDGLCRGALREAWLDVEEPERAAGAGLAFDAFVEKSWREYKATSPSVGRMAGLDTAPARAPRAYPVVTE